MAIDDPKTIYYAGGKYSTVINSVEPIVYKSTDGGSTWTNVLKLEDNQNVQTGWSGRGGVADWSYGEMALGFDVALNDADDLIVTDFGFVHRSTDGGTTWEAEYVIPADRNALGNRSSRTATYRGSGVDNTTSWSITWRTQNEALVANSDITSQVTRDGGRSFSFNYDGLNQNSVYRIVNDDLQDNDPATIISYAASADVHDIYQSTHLTDARLDSPRRDGAILFSADGMHWESLASFAGQVVWVEFDHTRPNRLYASVIETSDGIPQGGIWVTDNLDEGSRSIWRKLPAPPRTEGRPFNIRVLDDGALVASYSARRAIVDGVEQFTPSSGVFLSLDGGESWDERSAPAMRFWTKDVVIDPQDVAQDTWYAGVWSGWGRGGSRDQGGLYRTTDRGRSWTRIFETHRREFDHRPPGRPQTWLISQRRDPGCGIPPTCEPPILTCNPIPAMHSVNRNACSTTLSTKTRFGLPASEVGCASAGSTARTPQSSRTSTPMASSTLQIFCFLRKTLARQRPKVI